MQNVSIEGNISYYKYDIMRFAGARVENVHFQHRDTLHDSEQYAWLQNNGILLGSHERRAHKGPPFGSPMARRDEGR